MTQDHVTFTLADDQLMALDQALTAAETQLAHLVAMNAPQRRKLARMGDKSEAFCRQALSLLENNRQVVPPSLRLDDALADLKALDALRPRLHRLQRLSERAADTEALLGADVMRCALDGYALLKVAGRNQGLEGLRKELGTRFAKSPRATEPAAS